MSCDRCNEERARHSRYCSFCGADLSIPNGGLPCDSCSSCRIRGYRFCNVCGRDVSSDPLPDNICPGCAEYSSAGYRFCAVCGRPTDSYRPNVPAHKPSIKVSFILMTACVILCTLILFYEAYVGTVKLPYLMEAFEGHSYWLFIITPEVTKLFEIGDTGMRLIYVAELSIVIASIAYLLYSAFIRFRRSKGDTEALKETGLYEALCLNGLLFLFQFAYIMFCTANGWVNDTVEFDSIEEGMFSLMNASVYEEFLCRICMLGLPIGIISLILGKKDVPAYRYLLGGFGFRKWMLAFVLLSATFFAAGHLSGWGAWKFLPTFLFGLITAYLFIKYGLYATVSIHFLTDFMLSESWMTGNDLSVTLSLLFMLASLLALGAIPFYYNKVREIVTGWSTKKRV